MGGNQTNFASTQSTELRPGGRRENLALIFQEILTVITRLRTSRQAVMDAGQFRNSMKTAFTNAQADATRKGYTAEGARLASFAVVAFLDESVEDTNDPNFTDWSRQSMQEELFGDPSSGEIFFQCIDRLLARADAPEDADVLEVFALCLLLGYRGQYSTSGQEGVRRIITTVTEKIQRIRGPRPIAPDWAPSQDAVLQPPQDPWMRALIFGSLGALFLAVLFLVGFKIALISGASGLHSISQLTPH